MESLCILPVMVYSLLKTFGVRLYNNVKNYLGPGFTEIA